MDELERKLGRALELHESACAVNRRLQEEREGLIDRVERALRGIGGSS